MSNSLYIPTKFVQKKRTIYFIFTILYIYIFLYTPPYDMGPPQNRV